MNAVEIKNLSKNFGSKQAVCGLDMTVPMGAIYGFIGENGSGKSTTEKMICGLIPVSGGSIKLYGKNYTDQSVRAKIGVLIETPGCFPNLTVWDNMMLQAANLGISDAEKEIVKMLKTVRMEGAAGNKFKIQVAANGIGRELIHGEPFPIEIAGNAVQGYGLYIGGIYLDIAADGIKLGVLPHQAIDGDIPADRGNVKLRCGKCGRLDRCADIFDRQLDTTGDLDGELLPFGLHLTAVIRGAVMDGKDAIPQQRMKLGLLRTVIR